MPGLSNYYLCYKSTIWLLIEQIVFQNEVFNIIFAHKSLVHCYACAIKKSSCLKEFYVLEEYSLEGLQNVVDEFALKIVTFS